METKIEMKNSSEKNNKKKDDVEKNYPGRLIISLIN